MKTSGHSVSATPEDAAAQQTTDGARFRLTAGPVTPAQAVQAAWDIEAAIGEVANSKRKPGNLPVEPIAKLVQYVRDEAEAAKRFAAETVWCPGCEMQFGTEKLFMANREIDRLRAQIKAIGGA